MRCPLKRKPLRMNTAPRHEQEKVVEAVQRSQTHIKLIYNYQQRLNLTCKLNGYEMKHLS